MSFTLPLKLAALICSNLTTSLVGRWRYCSCTVRFWYIPREENMQAVNLADEGCMKDTQQPTTVRWTKKKTGGLDGPDRGYITSKT